MLLVLVQTVSSENIIISVQTDPLQGLYIVMSLVSEEKGGIWSCWLESWMKNRAKFRSLVRVARVKVGRLSDTI